jgi:hypothetical protein
MGKFKPSTRIALLHTIAKSIYASPIGKIKEAVANSRDNEADTFILYLSRDADSLSFFDNGTGITNDRFDEILNSIGYGLGQDKQDRFSYFGLGLFSVLELGTMVHIYSKVNGIFYHFEINSGEIFNPINAEKDISEIDNYIRYDNSELSQANSILDNDLVKNVFGSYPDNYTEIFISGIKKPYQEILSRQSYNNLSSELEQLLPLYTRDNEPFFERINDLQKKTNIIEMINDYENTNAIHFYLGIDQISDIKKLYKFYPQFNENRKFLLNDIEIGEATDKTFKYYYMFNICDLENSDNNRSHEQDVTGFWVRNRNVLVKKSDYFQKPGTRRSIIQSPLKKWIYGEILHTGMEKMLVVTRDEYLWNTDYFENFYKLVENEVVGDWNNDARRAYQYTKVVEENFLNSIINIDRDGSPLKRFESKTKHLQYNENIINTITKDLFSEKLENAQELSSMIDDSFTIMDNDKLLVHIIKNTQASGNEYVRKFFDRDAKRAVMGISSKVFEPKKTVFFNKTYEISYVYCEDNSFISINSDNQTIKINIFSETMLDYSLNMLDVLLYIEIAHAQASDIDDMRDIIRALVVEKNKHNNEITTYLKSMLSKRI